MKALTICQPYAHMIIVTKEKRVENRSWPTKHRGELLIHAGKSRAWLGQGDVDIVETFIGPANKRVSTSDLAGREIAFGAVIGIARLIDCLHVDEIKAGLHDEKYPWLRGHPHASGPWCWVLGHDVIQFADPVPMVGRLGLFNVNVQELTNDR